MPIHATTPLQNLKSLNYQPAECEQMLLVCDGGTPSKADRINRLRDNENLEEAVRAVLKHLGEMKRPYLTAVEEKLLSVIEFEYGIIDETHENLEEAARAVLKHLGELKRPYLTEFEEKLLGVIGEEYGIDDVLDNSK